MLFKKFLKAENCCYLGYRTGQLILCPGYSEKCSNYNFVEEVQLYIKIMLNKIINYFVGCVTKLFLLRINLFDRLEIKRYIEKQMKEIHFLFLGV